MKRLIFRFVPAFVMLVALVGESGLAQIQRDQVRPEGKTRVQTLLEEKLRLAASQHEIVKVLIEDSRFDEAETAYQELLSLGFSGPQEKLLAQSAWKIVEKLRSAGQHDIAHRIVSNSFNALEKLETRHTLLMLRAKLYQEQGNLSRALETLRQAKFLASSQ